MKKDLSINELLWLAAETTAPCPYCGKPVKVNAHNICLRMGMRVVKPDGTEETTKQSYIVDCEHCGKTIDVAFSAELKKAA